MSAIQMYARASSDFDVKLSRSRELLNQAAHDHATLGIMMHPSALP